MTFSSWGSQACLPEHSSWHLFVLDPRASSGLQHGPQASKCTASARGCAVSNSKRRGYAVCNSKRRGYAVRNSKRRGYAVSNSKRQRLCSQQQQAQRLCSLQQQAPEAMQSKRRGAASDQQVPASGGARQGRPTAGIPPPRVPPAMNMHQTLQRLLQLHHFSRCAQRLMPPTTSINQPTTNTPFQRTGLHAVPCKA